MAITLNCIKCRTTLKDSPKYVIASRKIYDKVYLPTRLIYYQPNLKGTF